MRNSRVSAREIIRAQRLFAFLHIKAGVSRSRSREKMKIVINTRPRLTWRRLYPG